MPLGLTWLDVLLIVALAMLLVQGHRRGLWAGSYTPLKLPTMR